MSKLSLIIALLLVQTNAFAAENSDVWRHRKTLGVNTVEGTIDTSTIRCYNGKEPKSGEFKVYASLAVANENLVFKGAGGSAYKGWHNSNAKEFYASLHGIYSCSDIPAELKPGQTIAFTAKQIFEEVYQKRGDGKCQKHFMEWLTLKLGQQELTGSASMIAFPIDVTHCE